MVLTDRTTALRIERVEVLTGIEWTEALARRAPELDAVAWRGAGAPGAVAIWSGAGSPLSRVLGLGMEGSVSDDALDAIEALYRARDTGVRIELCPLAQPGLAERLNRRGYRIADFENMLVRDVAPEDADTDQRPRATSPGVHIRAATRRDRALWAAVAVEGFFGGDGPDGFSIQMEPVFDLPDTAAFLATVDGEAAASAGVSWRDGVAALYGMATLARFRRRGIQRAMVAARLARAARAGCDLASVGARPGGDSQRNLERAGFRVCHTRVILARDFGPPAGAESGGGEESRAGG